MKNKAHGNLLFQTLVSLFPVSNAKKGKKLYFGQKENKGRRKQWRGEDKRWKVPLNPGHLLPHVSASLSDSHCSHAAQTPVR